MYSLYLNKNCLIIVIYLWCIPESNIWSCFFFFNMYESTVLITVKNSSKN